MAAVVILQRERGGMGKVGSSPLQAKAEVFETEEFLSEETAHRGERVVVMGMQVSWTDLMDGKD